jgi:hypothetical protein
MWYPEILSFVSPVQGSEIHAFLPLPEPAFWSSHKSYTDDVKAV